MTDPATGSPPATAAPSPRAPVRGRPRPGDLAVALAALAALALLAGTATVAGGFTGVVAGTATTRSVTHVIADTVGAAACTSSANAAGSITTNTATCAAPLAASPAGTTSVGITNQGGTAVTSASLTTGTCAVQSFADSSAAATSPAVTVGGVTYQTAGPPTLAGSLSATFDGTTGHLETTTQWPSPPSTFSLSVWFRTATTGTSAIIMGGSSDQGASATSWDRSLWLDTAGHLTFGVWPGYPFEVTSSQTTTRNFADAQWHHAVATVAPASSTLGTVKLYADGSLVAGSAGNEPLTSAGVTANAYIGWWHVGWGSAYYWANPPSSFFFAGSLAEVAVFPTELSAAQVAQLATPTSQNAEAAAIAALAPTSSWLLQDPPSTGYSGAIANVPANPTVLYRDASGNPGSNVATAQGGVTARAAGPPSGGTGAAFNGTTGYLSTATQWASPPYTFSVALWFKTSAAGVSSALFGGTSAPGNGGSNWDRSLWVDTAGHLVASVYTGYTSQVLSSATTTRNFADGQWHHVVATVAPVTASVGSLLLYADGVLVAGSAGNLAMPYGVPAETYNGWWHLGYAKSYGWANPPASDQFNGTLADVAVFPTALTATQVDRLYGAATRAATATAVTGGVATATAFWPLDDNAPASPACGYLGIAVAAAGRCVLPTQSGPCPSPMSAAAPPTTAALPTTLPTLTVTTARIGSTPATATGLHVLVPWRIETTGGGFTATLGHDRGVITL